MTARGIEKNVEDKKNFGNEIKPLQPVIVNVGVAEITGWGIGSHLSRLQSQEGAIRPFGPYVR